ncbi:hypothetical protein CPB83DRAFT_806739 [Crepidotus variabilis]|uniref:Phorbol-ester/DAG-type domain-containing protein n=1 Tax=Crepidotus variabilis TaxID=179855 RepID=A0A9P6JU21_9AGAR|nr:hypothetical protein CPB83DRAFT_806739 [Crepidotus variabilis]
MNLSVSNSTPSSPIEGGFKFNVYNDPWDGQAASSGSAPIPSMVSRQSIAPLTYGLASTQHGVRPNMNNRARNESRKLLSHVLLQLANRRKPPSVVEALTNASYDPSERGLGALAVSFKEAVKGMKSEKKPDRANTLQGDDSDEETSDTFTTDETIDLMLQLEDVLTMSLAQGWMIFDDRPNWQETIEEDGMKLASSFRRSRQSFRAGGKRSRSSSPQKNQIEVPQLLSVCISILASVVSEDCRYRVASPRPSRPPNMLQALTLNIAQFLAHTHRHDPEVIAQISFAMIPAFSAFEPQMHIRLITFFDISIIRGALFSLKLLQGQSILQTPPASALDPFESQEPPVVSIQIEEVQPDNASAQPTKLSQPSGQIQSTNNPQQHAHIYHLAFVIPPLLSAIFDSLEVQDGNMDLTIPPVLLLLVKGMASFKADLYNDLLEIIAFRGQKARKLAVAFLARLWPRAVGHSTISSPFSPPESWEARRPRIVDVHTHQFTSWFMDSPRPRLRTTELRDDCRSCSEPVAGFCLMCTLCMAIVHLDCYDYPEGNSQIQYCMADDARVQRIAMYRFCDLKPNGDPQSEGISVHGHHLRPANWFTMCLCFACKQPLWGCSMQGFRCVQCSIPIHVHCTSALGALSHCDTIAVTSTEMTITLDALRQSCLNSFPILNTPKEQLETYGHEEISIFREVLRTQVQLLENGKLMGSMSVSSTGWLSNSTEFELHRVLAICEQLFASKLRCTSLTEQYMEDTNSVHNRPSVLFNLSYMEFIGASVKASEPQSPNRMASGFLNVDHLNDDGDKTDGFTYESVPLLHIRNILEIDFAIHSDDAAKLLVNQLLQLGFIDRKDHQLVPFDDVVQERDVECIFPLPLGLDLSLNVEILVSAIESCLTDLDLASNEFGFLLLTRKFWPNGLASEYGLTRLAGRIISWILDEDDKLAIILREYIAKQNSLPGMRTSRYVPVWPSHSDNRPAPSANLMSNGGDFVVARRALLSRFAVPWLLELHDLDPMLYCRIIFQHCIQAADDHEFEVGLSMVNKDPSSTRYETILRAIIKLSQSSVIFTSFDEILLQSMQIVVAGSPLDKPSASIYKLFSNETEGSQRGTAYAEVTPGQLDKQNLLFMDSFRVILTHAKQSPEGLETCLAILPLVVKSGIIISTTFFKDVLDLIDAAHLSFLSHVEMLLKAITFTLWLRSIGRQDLQVVIASLHAKFSPHFADALTTSDPSLALSVLRHSFAACLLIYGCERPSLIENGFVTRSDADAQPSRRKFTTRGSEVMDPIFIDPLMLSALQLYVETDSQEVLCFVAKFFHSFIMESPYLEGFEVDNFVLQNGKLIANCVWAAYDIQREDIAAVRTHLLLRNIVIDSDPFEDIIETSLDPNGSPKEKRLSAINRIFRIVSDVLSPAFFVEGRQWRSSVVPIFYHYFSTLWSDPTEEVRLAVKVFSASLLPAHFDMISLCWDEALVKAPISERLRLLSFLIQLRPHFPTWGFLSWSSIIEALTEFDYDTNTSVESPEYRMSAVDPDMANLRVSILLLGMQMLADGIEIDSFFLMKLKVQFVQMAGFINITVMPTPSGRSFYLRFGDIPEISETCYPCIEELVHVLDSPHQTKTPLSALGLPDDSDDKTASILVGSLFIDAALCALSTIKDLPILPVLTLKSLLEALYIIVHKCDFEDAMFSHMQPLLRRAVLRAVEVLSKEDMSYELRQLAMTITQTCIKKWHSILGASVPAILDTVTTEVAGQVRHSQDPLVVQGKLLIGTTLHTFSQNGLLLSLLRRPLQPQFFTVLKQVFAPSGSESNSSPNSICDQLIRDTLIRVIDIDAASMQTVLPNVCTFIDVVHSQGYTFETILFVGQQLTQLARRLSDGTIAAADPSPLITISAILIQNNKRHSRELLPYVDTVLRVSLNRLNIQTEPLLRLIEVALAHKSKSTDAFAGGSTDIINILFEILLDGLKMKTKMPPLTIKCLIEALLLADLYSSLQAGARDTLFKSAVDDSFTFLQNHSWNEENIDNDFKAVAAAATLFLHEINRNAAVFLKFVEQGPERTPKGLLNIRSWNVLLLVALQEEKDDWLSLLHSHFNAFSHTFSSMMRSYSNSGISSPAAAATDVNQAHIAMKLWLMLANLRSWHGGETIIAAIWNELWASYESFLDVVETEAQVGLYPTLISLAATSVADLLMYLRSLRSSAALDVSSHLAILARMKAITRADSSATKIVRAMRSLSEPPPEVPANVALDQIAKELVAAEKIRVMESKKTGDHRIMGGDRSRREGR